MEAAGPRVTALLFLEYAKDQQGGGWKLDHVVNHIRVPPTTRRSLKMLIFLQLQGVASIDDLDIAIGVRGEHHEPISVSPQTEDFRGGQQTQAGIFRIEFPIEGRSERFDADVFIDGRIAGSSSFQVTVDASAADPFTVAEKRQADRLRSTRQTGSRHRRR